MFQCKFVDTFLIKYSYFQNFQSFQATFFFNFKLGGVIPASSVKYERTVIFSIGSVNIFCIKAPNAHHRQLFVCTIKVFQLAKTCSEIIAGDIFRPDACGVMFVCSRMDSGYEHVGSCGKSLKKETRS